MIGKLIALLVGFHAVYLLVPPARATIHEYVASCPLALPTVYLVSAGDRNGLNPR